MTTPYQNISFAFGDTKRAVMVLAKSAHTKYSSICIIEFIIVASLCFSYVGADNFTDKYLRVHHEGQKHEPRFLTFHTEEQGDLTIDLEFAVPFITIPVKKTVENAHGIYKNGLANINVGALILGGAVIFGAAVLVPLVTSFIVKSMMVSPLHRVDEPNDSWRIMTIIDQALIENNIDTTSCMQRTMCWLAKNSRNKLNSGQAASYDKIIDGLMSNPWLNQMIEGSAMQTAIVIGLQNHNCSVHYKNCKITQHSIQSFANKFSNYLKFRK